MLNRPIKVNTLRKGQTCRKMGTQSREPKVDTTRAVGLPKSESNRTTIFV